jgi:RNA polymerase II-associated factor 1
LFSRIGFSIKKYFKEEELYRDRESQIKAIESTFDAVKAPVSVLTLGNNPKLIFRLFLQIDKHYSKPNIYPIDVLPVYPDFDVSFSIHLFVLTGFYLLFILILAVEASLRPSHL